MALPADCVIDGFHLVKTEYKSVKHFAFMVYLPNFAVLI